MSTTTIPARIVGYARESLCRQLGMAAQDIAQVSEEGDREHPERYADPVERFDRTRVLLDLIGWKDAKGGGPATVSLAWDRQTLLAALDSQLEVERDMMDEDPRLAGAERQIRTARWRACEIEGFLSEARAERVGGA